MTTLEQHVAGTPTWVDLMSPEPAKAQAFYAGLFGWQYEVGGPETGGYAMAKLGGKNVAGIGPLPPGAPYPSAWSVYFATEDADRTIATVEELGGRVMTGPMDVVDAGRLAFMTDPTGAPFGVWQAKNHRGAEIIDEPGTMTWHEVNTPDAPKAVEFYGKLFGLEPKKLDAPAGFDYWTLHKGPRTAAGVLQMTKEWAGVPPHWMNYFAVADTTDAAAAKVTELGGKVSVPPFDSPYGRISVVNDPFGAVFSLIKLAGPAK